MIIGVSGKARVGKNQFCDYLIECFQVRHRRNFTEMAFAYELKKMCQDHFDLSDEQLWGDEKEINDKRFPCPDRQGAPPYCLGNRGDGKGLEYMQERKFWTPREIMQEFGGFYRRMRNDYWVYNLDKSMKAKGHEDVTITDVRHINECEYVKNNQGVLIRVVRPDAGYIHGMNHESETALDSVPDNYFDIEINNHGTLEDLYGAAEDASDAIVIIDNMIKKGRIEVNG